MEPRAICRLSFKKGVEMLEYNFLMLKCYRSTEKGRARGEVRDESTGAVAVVFEGGGVRGVLQRIHIAAALHLLELQRVLVHVPAAGHKP